MSLNLSVYVGPYIESENVPNAVIEQFGDLVCCGRGEIDCDEPKRYLIPNRDLNGVTRKMSFDRHDEPPVIEINDIVAETTAMRNLTEPFLAAVRSNPGTCRIRWGIVCGVF